MGMVASFHLVSAACVDALIAAPESVRDLVNGADADAPVATMDVDKAWHGLHFLLTATAWEGEPPLDFLVRGGTHLGEVEVGYGPARLFTPAQVADISRALAPLTRAALRARYDPVRMQQLEIYPELWGRGLAEGEGLGYLLGYFEPLRDFVARGAADRLGLVVAIS